jgi:hypothetical protein
MNCMDCMDCSVAGPAMAAVAVCHDCGAAVCRSHAVVREHHLTRTVPINQVVPVEPPARIVRCAVCAAAHDAARPDAAPPH